MLRKFFPRDKNYILEQAQLSLQQPLLQYLVDFVKVEYLLRHNPLGIQDETASRIQQHQSTDFRHLNEFYINLMGLFRFTHYSDNQLEFIFEAKDDFEKYQEEWTTQFKTWTKEFCKHPNFLRAVLDLTVFYPADSPVLLMDTRMNTFITHFFEVKIHPQKGIIRTKVA
ncbi:MAG: hypothetical protein JNM57_15440 [Cyclobacteriaceae bacterium]|nr:hypothetical protein [Cyclobacteriaceae bacterium]